MDLVADELVSALERHFASEVSVRSVRPALARRASRVPLLRNRRVARHADIVLSRFWDYGRLLRSVRADVYHVSDHSYAHLLYHLPRPVTGVYCHDLHAFRCLLEPKLEPRPLLYRRMMQRVLAGMQQAAVVFYSTSHVRRAIEQSGIIELSRLVHAPYGTAAEFVAEPAAGDTAAQRQLGLEPGAFVMHVGSCIERKRLDVLIEAFARSKAKRPSLKLLQVGGTWTPAQTRLLSLLGVASSTVQVRAIPRTLLAALYRGAALVLQPSEAEGFGLPVIEALACGAPVVASAIASLEEAGGDATLYAPVGDVAAFSSAIEATLEDPGFVPTRERRLAHAGRFSWRNHARIVLDGYLRLLSPQKLI